MRYVHELRVDTTSCDESGEAAERRGAPALSRSCKVRARETAPLVGTQYYTQGNDPTCSGFRLAR